ncbi:uncharacterized protein PpBr36_09806 [Pyricularia pennisetigena]|uniref:uncharacterized protein n=1 Tax=Pyricularia pennisetigena TaxID=1578925 RepID=UPI00114F4C59|nr:uncharacterized protein PpBr36_09806 [Pyricularia pennisetigena]TLS22439.1 hypothetical protein PpBr36_09806 [Pyricularia pennisetigena]
MLLKHAKALMTSLVLLLVLILPTVSAHSRIQGNIKCGVWMAPLEANTATKRAALRSVAEAAIHRLCRADRSDCAGSADVLHNYCNDDEWSDDGSTHVMIDLITRNGVRQDRIAVDDCLEMFDNILKHCVESKWQEGSFTEANGNRIVNLVYEQECDSSPTGLCG